MEVTREVYIKKSANFIINKLIPLSKKYGCHLDELGVSPEDFCEHMTWMVKHDIPFNSNVALYPFERL